MRRDIGVWVKNEFNEPNVLFSFQEDIKIGDVVFLKVNGQFFGRMDKEPEKYVGFVQLVSEGGTTISTTPITNKSHGYRENSRKENLERVETPIPIRLITDYCIMYRR